MIEFIFIKEVAKELGCKDSRTVISWCERNGVGVLKIAGGKKSYLIKEEFEAVRNKQAIDYIKEKYGSEKMPEVSNSSMIYFSKSSKTEIANEYRALGRNEEDFLNRLQNLI